MIFYLLDFLLTSDSLLPYCKQSLKPVVTVSDDCHHLGGLLVDGSHDCRKQDRNEDAD